MDRAGGRVFREEEHEEWRKARDAARFFLLTAKPNNDGK